MQSTIRRVTALEDGVSSSSTSVPRAPRPPRTKAVPLAIRVGISVKSIEWMSHVPGYQFYIMCSTSMHYIQVHLSIAIITCNVHLVLQGETRRVYNMLLEDDDEFTCFYFCYSPRPHMAIHIHSDC